MSLLQQQGTGFAQMLAAAVIKLVSTIAPLKTPGPPMTQLYARYLLRRLWYTDALQGSPTVATYAVVERTVPPLSRMPPAHV